MAPKPAVLLHPLHQPTDLILVGEQRNLAGIAAAGDREHDVAGGVLPRRPAHGQRLTKVGVDLGLDAARRVQRGERRDDVEQVVA